MKKIINYFKEPKFLAILNFILILIAIVFNYFSQVFCIPVFWAIIVLIIISFSIILYPLFFQNKKLTIIFSFLNGIGFCILIYCILFLEQMNFYGLMMSIVIVGLVTFIPHFLAIQLIAKQLFKAGDKKIRIGFVLGIVVSFCTVFYINNEYKNALISIENFKKSEYQELEKSYFTERILGMHFIYHTRFCEYDGWRPPKHDPFLNIGMWINARKDPLKGMKLTRRLELYKKFFSTRKYKFNCSCALEESNAYQKDKLWK